MPGTLFATWVFGPFALHGASRLLLRAGAPVPLAADRFDILAALAGQAPRAVAAVDLLAFLEIGFRDGDNLRAAVCELNAMLAVGSPQHYVAQTGPEQYRFMGSIKAGNVLGVGQSSLRGQKGWLPARGQPVVGRERAIERIQAQFPACRLVTVTGAGGIGKTTVAMAVAAGLGPAFEQGATFVDLAPLSDRDALAPAIAVSLGIGLGEADVQAALQDFLCDKQLLLLLDNCEHLISAVAGMAEQLLNAPGLCILATSREPLRARGEVVYQLQPMEVPLSSDGISAQDAAGYSAVQFFVQAARNEAMEFQLSDVNAGAVSAICQRLDGIPLALELAAGHVGSQGVDRLAAHLRTSPLNLPPGNRSLEDRHRTLEATLDWSHSMLDSAEQAVLRRISVFRSTFPLGSATRVANDNEIDEGRAIDALLGLAAKSLVQVSSQGGTTQYRLLEVTRTYAAGKLIASPELSAIRLKYAQDCCERLQSAEDVWDSMPGPLWMQLYGRLIQDVRCGLDWAVAEPGTERVALRLLLASLPLAGRMSLLDEYSERIGKGLDRLRASGDPDPVLELQLTSALTALMLNQNISAQAIEAMSEKVQQLATELGDDRYGAIAGTAVWMSSVIRGDYPRATTAAARQLEWAQRQGDPTLLADAQRQVAYCCHYMGNQAQAASFAMGLLSLRRSQTKVSIHTVNQIDHRVAMRIVLSRVQWLTGSPLQALQTIQEAIDLAECDRPTALCQALAFGGCQIALWCGDHALAAQWSQRLDRFAASSKLPLYRHWATHYNAVLAIRDGRDVKHTTLPPLTPMQHDAFATLEPSWAGAVALARVEQGLVGWCAPEVLRANGERMLLGGRHPEMVEQQWLRALALSREQGVLAWELRAATSLARLARRQGADAQARGLLEPVYLKFSEGLDTRDLRDARALLRS